MSTGASFRKVLAAARLPSLAHKDDAAYDVYAAEDTMILQGDRGLVRTGLVMVFCPEGVHPQLCPRSGLALNQKIDVVAGIIDPGYRGEICVLLHNHGPADVVFLAGDRVAQMRFVNIVRPEMTLTTEAPAETARGSNGFGSTGVRDDGPGVLCT